MNHQHQPAAIYHGTLTDLHGPCEVLGECLCADCRAEWMRYSQRDDDQLPDVRWQLRIPTSDRILEHVRPGSFTRCHTAPHRRVVDPGALVCPGCREWARPRPPGYWRVADGLPAPRFSHSDGSALCRTDDGAVADPVEIKTLAPLGADRS